MNGDTLDKIPHELGTYNKSSASASEPEKSLLSAILAAALQSLPSGREAAVTAIVTTNSVLEVCLGSKQRMTVRNTSKASTAGAGVHLESLHTCATAHCQVSHLTICAR